MRQTSGISLTALSFANRDPRNTAAPFSGAPAACACPSAVAVHTRNSAVLGSRSLEARRTEQDQGGLAHCRRVLCGALNFKMPYLLPKLAGVVAGRTPEWIEMNRVGVSNSSISAQLLVQATCTSPNLCPHKIKKRNQRRDLKDTIHLTWHSGDGNPRPL